MIYVHIGLPKTATTSLQKYLSNEKHSDKIKYIGVNQPRNSGKENDLYNSFIEYMNSQTFEALSKRRSHCEILIEQSFESTNKPLFLSEEMISVDNIGLTWQTKIERLSALLGRYPHKVVVTIREPISALHSFYIELYKSVKSKYPTLMDFCLYNNNAHIYNYSLLREELCLFFKSENIILYPFERLVQSNILTNFFKELSLDIDCSDSWLPLTNVKRKRSNGSFTQALTVDDWISNISISESTKNRIRGLIGSWKIPFTSRFIKQIDSLDRDEIEKIYKSEFY